MRYEKEGVSYNSRNGCIKFYDKFNQCHEKEAYGILRQEHTLRKSELGRLIGRGLTLSDIDLNKIADVLDNDLKKLGLFGHWINTPSRISESLSTRFGTLAGTYFFGLLCQYRTVDKDMLPSVTKSHPRSIDRQLHKIKDEIEMPLTMTEFVHPLPPLKIDRKIFLNKG